MQSRTPSSFLIVNADDLGASPGVNAGIAEAHDQGIVTSTSLMVHGPAAGTARAVCEERPRLSVGLHWDITSPWAPGVDAADASAVGSAVEQQLFMFQELMGRAPTHLDAHHHAHVGPVTGPAMAMAAERVGVPLRGASDVNFIGDYLARPEHGADEHPREIGGRALRRVLRTRVADGWNELMCHPAQADPTLESDYTGARVGELRALTDPRLPGFLARLGIELRSYIDHARA